MFVVPKAVEIKQMRVSKGMTMQELSCKAHLPDNAVYRIEKGECKVTNRLRAKEISRALGCKIGDLFTETRKGE